MATPTWCSTPVLAGWMKTTFARKVLLTPLNLGFRISGLLNTLLKTVCKRCEKLALQWESWRVAVHFSSGIASRKTPLWPQCGLYRSLYSERKTYSGSNRGSLSGKIDIVNNDTTMTGRFDVVISNVKAPNGVRSVSVPIWSETGVKMTLFGIQPTVKQMGPIPSM